MANFCLSCAVLIVIGAFYTFAGFAATRVSLTSYFLDRAIAAIAMKKPSRQETLHFVWMLVASLVILAGGLCLIFQTELAAWLFVLSALGQALYIGVVAPRVFDVDDPPDPEGRRRTVNAFILYTMMTLGVVWAGLKGHLTSIADTPLSHYALIGAVLMLNVAYIASCLRKLKAPPPASDFDDGSDTPSDNEDRS